MKEKKIKLLICDLDNTLYDWVSYFVHSFYAMVDTAVEIIGCSKERLLNDLQAIHQKHNDSEHPFALLETDIVEQTFPDMIKKEIAAILDPALHAFNRTRMRTLKLHEGVNETFQSIQESGIRIVAHTESKLYAVVDRLRRLEIEQYFSSVYCRERSKTVHPYPESATLFLNEFPLHKITELTQHQIKPDPKVLLEICSKEGYDPQQVAYIGDSMARDILMAKKARVYAIWAKYGAVVNQEDYNRLVRITHWTNEDVKRESKLRQQVLNISPDYTADISFKQVLIALGLVNSANCNICR